MTIAQQVARVSANVETATRAGEFIQAVRFLMIGKGNATRLAEESRAPAHVIEFIKSPAAAGSMTGWGQPLASFQNLATAFLSSLTGISVFDTLWSSMLQAPLRTSVIAVSTMLTGSGVSEASSKPVSNLSLSASDLDATKAAAFVALSAELMRNGSPSTLSLLQRQLRSAISRATNSIFLPLLTASATSVASGGVQATGVRQDLRVLLSLVSSGADSKLFLITTRKIAEAWSVLPDSSGGPAFPNASVTGGEIGGIPIIPCDECTDGEIILADAMQVAAGSEGITLDSTTQASINLDSAPDSPPSASTVMTSLWQNNLVGLKAERLIGAKVLHSDAVAKITGASYTGGSPA